MKVVIHTKAGAAIEYVATELVYEIVRDWVHVLRVDRDPRYLFARHTTLVRIGSVAKGDVLSISVSEDDVMVGG